MMNELTAKKNEGMASTQVMLRVADILNGRGSIDDVEPFLRDQVAHELDMYSNQRKNTVQIVTDGNVPAKEETTDGSATDQ
jgi:fibrillarin-like rRNA methylase